MPAENSETALVLRAVRARQRRLALLKAAISCTLIVAGIYAAFLIAARLLGVVPDVFNAQTLMAVPVIGALLSVLLAHRPDDAEAARAIDTVGGHKDLFLSTVLVDANSANYAPIMTKEAAAQAVKVDPCRIVPIQVGPQLRKLGMAAVALMLAVAFLPQLDPFGHEEARKQEDKQKKRLAETVQATMMRKEVVKKQNPEAENSKAVEQELQDLKKTLNNLKPKEMKQNEKMLSESQKDLGQMWRKLSEEKLKRAFNDMGGQQFGSGDIEKRRKWKRSLSKGDASELKKEMQQLRRLAKEMGEMKEGAKKDEARRELTRRLQTLKKFLENEAGSKQLNETMQRALEQLAMTQRSQKSGSSQGDSKISRDALQAMQQSLQLSESELESMAQAMRDLESLEEALQALQQAKKANAQCQGVDGSQCQGMASMGDYESFYNSLMNGGQGGQPGNQPGNGNGPGMGGGGTGKGGVAKEDDKGDTDFVHHKAKVAVTKGKMLLEWKMQELAEPGQAQQNYANGIQEVKQGVSEAILQEQVPPGYHKGIQGYFDSLE